MNFETPLTIDVLPVYEDFLNKYKKPFPAKLVFQSSLKIYYRTILSRQQNNKCIWCECEMTHERNHSNSTTIEHMIPRSLGGADDPENYAVACSRCNHKRGIMTISSFRDHIRNGGLHHPGLSKTQVRKLGRERKKREAVENLAIAS